MELILSKVYKVCGDLLQVLDGAIILLLSSEFVSLLNHHKALMRRRSFLICQESIAPNTKF